MPEAPPTEPEAAPSQAEAQPARKAARKRRSLLAWLLIVLAGLAAIVVLLSVGARYGVLLPQARALIEARTSGLKIGRYGRLKIEGLSGDIWRSFAIRRLTITDERGVWLQASDLAVDWNALPLFHRRLVIDRLRARQIQVLRRPTLTPKGVSKAAPLSIEIKDAKTSVETLPAFSTKHGLFDAALKLDLERDGGQRGEVTLDSRMHAGDHLHARFDMPKNKPFAIDADALESQGGALAGAAGLSAERPFTARVSAGGSMTEGGRIDAHVFSGADQPLTAVGAWTRQGGTVKGQAVLGASTLLRGYADMIGPQLNFTMAGRRGAGGVYGVGARVWAQNLHVAVKGRIDPKTRSAPQGLDVDILVPQVKRVTKLPYLDRGRAVGRVTGSKESWRFKGAADLTGVSLNGYNLARVSGPLELSSAKGEIRAQANLVGAGGSGKGMVPGMAGAAPRLFVDLSRFSDGRVLIRSVKLAGAGFTLTGSGARSIFGGLSFKGDATVNDIGRLRPGATGVVRAAFNASQGGGDKPWVLSFDARTERFHSGVAQLDRLLGATPRLSGNGDYRDGAINIGAAHLVASAASVNARGLLKVSGPMNLSLDWTAKGPFQAGPVEIVGDWRGKGAITGTMAAPAADLTAHINRLDIPRLPLREVDVALKLQKIANAFDGAVSVNGQSDYGPARARANYRFMPSGVDLSGIDADGAGVRAQGAVSLRGGAPSTADLQVAIGPGLLLVKGSATGTVKLANGAGPAQAQLDLQARDAVVRGSAVAIRTAHLTASGPIEQLPYRIEASGASGVTPFNIDGAGVYQLREGRQTISLNGQGKVRTVDFRTLDALTVQLGPDGRSVHAHIGTASGEATLNARDAKGDLTATGSLNNIDLKALNPDFAGRITGQLALNGRGDRLQGDISARLAGARPVGAPDNQSLNADVRGHLADSRLTLALNGSSEMGLRAKADVVLPTEASASPLRLAINRTKPISGDFDVSGEVKPLWDLFLGGDRTLSGKVQLAGALGGTLAEPRVRGSAQVRDGGFEDYTTGVRLTHLQADAQLGSDTVTLTSLTANDNKSGKVAGSGTISLQRGGASNLALQLTNFRLIDNDTATANASGQVDVVRAADGKVRVQGDLRIIRAQINAEAKLKPGVVSMDVVEIHRPEKLAAQLPAPKASGLAVSMDVRLRAPGGVMIRGRGIIAEFSVFAHVTGSTAAPVLSGTARVVDGFYDFGGRRFQFDQRGSISLDTNIERIRLDLQATLADPTLSATVQIRGTAARPEVSLTSSPALPEDEILAYIIFGRSASQLSSPEAAQMASLLSSLAAGGGFDVLGNLREFAGLDRLAFGADQSGGVTVSGGKYVTNNIYVELIGGGVYGASAQVDWRIKRSFSIVSTLGGQFGSKIAVRWRKDLGGGRRGQRTSAGGASAPPPPNRP